MSAESPRPRGASCLDDDSLILDMRQAHSHSFSGQEARGNFGANAAMTYNFDGSPVVLDDEEDEEAADQKPLAKSFSWGGSPRLRRCDTPDLPPEAIVQLHKLHEAFLKYSGTEVKQEDTSEAALDAVWGKLGTWHVHGMLPAGPEKPLKERALRALPGKIACAETQLRRNCLAMINMKGQKGPSDQSKGQDNCSFSRLPGNWDVVCVMDGHGPNGHWPATRACRSLPFFLRGTSCETMLRHGEVEAALTHAVSKVQMDLKVVARREDVDLQASGCTAVCAAWNFPLRRLCVAHVGDSRVVLLVPGRGVVAQTQDHKPSTESERERIEQSGGQVVRNEFQDGYVEYRVNRKGEDFPGISMSRSLGDLSVKECGVVADPEVAMWELPPTGLVLAATDGVWEFMSVEEVANIVFSGLEQALSLKDVLAQVIQAARDAWRSREGIYCDDITAVLASVSGTASSGHRRTSVLKASGCGDGVCQRCQVS